MVRVQVELKQHNIVLPIIEVVINLFYNETSQEKVIANLTVSRTVKTLEKVINSCNGRFYSSQPKCMMEKHAKIGVFMTVVFKNFSDLEKFEQNLGKMFG